MKISVTLDDRDLQDLRELAANEGLTLRAAMEQAVITTCFLDRRRRAGNRVLIHRPDGRYEQVVWRDS